MTAEETTRQAAWQAMSKKARIAWLRSGNVLNITSAQRQAAVAQLKKNAGGH